MSAVNAHNPTPRVILELVSGLDPEHPQIQTRFDDVPGGWPMVVQMLQGALGAAIIQAFRQLQQQSAVEHNRVEIVREMDSPHGRRR